MTLISTKENSPQQQEFLRQFTSLAEGTRVDPEERTVRVAGGSTWGDVDHATHAFGLATPSGIISTTGVGGLTHRGGLGHLTRACGLSIDNFLSDRRPTGAIPVEQLILRGAPAIDVVRPNSPAVPSRRAGDA